MIPSGMMRTKCVLQHPVVVGDDLGQQSVSFATFATLVCHVESSERRDAQFAGAPGANQATVVAIPYVSGVKVGDRIGLVDGEATTYYDVQRVEDDRTRHVRLRLECLAAEEVG